MIHFTDEELMLQVAQGNLDVLSVLFDRYHIRIYNFFQKMLQNKMLSEDLTQEVFIKIIKYKNSYKEGNFTAWIYTIARNIFSSHYQQQKKERNVVNEDEINSNLVLEKDNNDEEIAHLHKVLQKLKPKDRELIVMHKLQEIQYSQIAEIIGGSETAVKVRTHRALKKLKDIYFETHNG